MRTNSLIAPLFSGFALCVWSADPVVAQGIPVTIHTATGTATDQRLGDAVASVGDVNSDGIDDFVTGEPGFNGFRGRAVVRSGASGAAISGLTFNGTTIGDYVGDAVAGVGDANGHGTPDILVGAPLAGSFNGSVTLYSGETGAALATYTGTNSMTWGQMVAGVGDLNADGYPDYAFNASTGTTPTVQVRSGQNNALLFTVTAPGGSSGFGSDVAVGDVDGDGNLDLIVASSPACLAYSGTGSAISLSLGAGFAIACPGDVSGDGRDDVVIGNYSATGPAGGTGATYAYSGASGALLWTRYGTLPGDDFGLSLDTLGDLDGDGVQEVIVGAPQSGTTSPVKPGYVHVLSGADGCRLSEFPEPTGQFGSWFGWSVANGGDLDADGVDDVLIGNPRGATSPLYAGRYYAMHGAQAGAAIGTSVCFCTTGLTTGACNNAGPASAGCVNSFGTQSRLAAYGSTSVAADSLFLVADHIGVGASTLFFTGTALGSAVVLDDGLVCASGSIHPPYRHRRRRRRGPRGSRTLPAGERRVLLREHAHVPGLVSQPRRPVRDRDQPLERHRRHLHPLSDRPRSALRSCDA
jgi:hypothetical protein